MGSVGDPSFPTYRSAIESSVDVHRVMIGPFAQKHEAELEIDWASGKKFSGLCGLHSDEIRQVLVTPGIGTSVLPVRLGTQAQWELVTLHR